MPEVGPERTETCQECGREYDPRKEGYYVDTDDVGADASGGTATVFRQDAEKFGDWLGFEEEDIGPWCEDCSWKIQRRRTRNSAEVPEPDPGDEPLTDGGGQDVLIHTSPIDLGHKWLGNLGADELAYWRVSGTPQRTEPGCRVWFESGGRIIAWGEIESVEDGKLWFDGAHKTDLPCPDDAPTRGFTYIDPLLPRLDEVPGSARSHDTGSGEVRTDGGDDVYRVRIWKGGTAPDEHHDGDPDEVVEVEEETPHVWQDDPRYTSPPLGIDVHPDDCPATLNIYTSESIRSPPGYESHVEKAYWDGPMERGLEHPADHDYPPFGCSVWGRVMFFVESEEEAVEDGGELRTDGGNDVVRMPRPEGEDGLPLRANEREHVPLTELRAAKYPMLEDGITMGTICRYLVDEWSWVVVTDLPDETWGEVFEEDDERADEKVVRFLNLEKLSDAEFELFDNCVGCYEHLDTARLFQDHEGAGKYIRRSDFLEKFEGLGPFHPDSVGDRDV